jgi:hypothetical protein
VLALGAAMENEGTLTITNSTISGNSSESNDGGVFNVGPLTIISSTVFDIVNPSHVTMNFTNSIIVGCFNTNGTIGVNDHNLPSGSLGSLADVPSPGQ